MTGKRKGTKSRELPWDEYEAIYRRLAGCLWLTSTRMTGNTMFMLDDDFLPTQKMAEVRWIMHDCQFDCTIFQVDNAGDAILLIKGPM